jgi:16S rRNA (uracil1498-N3)-methyltransferase
VKDVTLDDRSPPYGPIVTAAAVTLQEPLALDAVAAASLLFRKVNVKEAFTLLGPEGRWYRCALQSVDASGATALPYEIMASSPESSARITLVVAVLQRQRMLVVAQKAAELGATRITPCFTSRSVQADGLAHEKVHAWPAQAVKGARQCRRGSVPPVDRARPLSEVVTTAGWRDAALRVFLDDRSEVAGALGAARGGDVVLVVGPEGGFSAQERALMVEHGARPLRLGGRVLRAETAVFAGLTVLQHRLGDMGIDEV